MMALALAWSTHSPRTSGTKIQSCVVFRAPFDEEDIQLPVGSLRRLVSFQERGKGYALFAMLSTTCNDLVSGRNKSRSIPDLSLEFYPA